MRRIKGRASHEGHDRRYRVPRQADEDRVADRSHRNWPTGFDGQAPEMNLPLRPYCGFNVVFVACGHSSRSHNQVVVISRLLERVGQGGRIVRKDAEIGHLASSLFQKTSYGIPVGIVDTPSLQRRSQIQVRRPSRTERPEVAGRPAVPRTPAPQPGQYPGAGAHSLELKATAPERISSPARRRLARLRGRRLTALLFLVVDHFRML